MFMLSCRWCLLWYVYVYGDFISVPLAFVVSRVLFSTGLLLLLLLMLLLLLLLLLPSLLLFCACIRVCACVRACMRAYMHVCVRVCNNTTDNSKLRKCYDVTSPTLTLNEPSGLWRLLRNVTRYQNHFKTTSKPTID